MLETFTALLAYAEDRDDEKLVGRWTLCGVSCLVLHCPWLQTVLHMQVDHCEEELLEGRVDAFRAIADHRAGTLERSLLLAFHNVARGACKRSYKRRMSMDEVRKCIVV